MAAFEGYLEKQSPSIFKRWQKRYFLLQGDTLSYWETQDDRKEAKTPKGTVKIAEVKQVHSGESSGSGDDKVYPFDVRTDERVYKLRTHNLGDRMQWCNVLKQAMAQHRGTDTSAAPAGRDPVKAEPTLLPHKDGEPEPIYMLGNSAPVPASVSSSSKRASRTGGSRGSRSSRKGGSSRRGGSDKPRGPVRGPVYGGIGGGPGIAPTGKKWNNWLSLEDVKKEQEEERRRKEAEEAAQWVDEEVKVRNLGGVHHPYRHMAGAPEMQRTHYTKVQHDTGGSEANLLTANQVYFAVPWVGGGGPVYVCPMTRHGRQADHPTLITANKSKPSCLDLSYTYNELLACGCDDGRVNVFKFTRGGPHQEMNEATGSMHGHSKKVLTANWHPTASNVLLTASMDEGLIAWDVEAQAERCSWDGQGSDVMFNLTFSWDGGRIATASRDKILRVYDPRAASEMMHVTAAKGPKRWSAVWMGKQDKVATVGFDKGSQREIQLYDLRSINKPFASKLLDTSSSPFICHYDPELDLLWLAGKGETVIRSFETRSSDPHLFENAEYRSDQPQLGLAYLPKPVLDVKQVQVMRVLKLTPKNVVEPHSFIVPRTRKEFFQDDLYPPSRTYGEPVINSDAFFSGKNAAPALASLNKTGMKPLSQAPSKAAPRRKYNRKGKEDGELTETEFFNRWANSTMTNAAAEEKRARGNSSERYEGVDPSEWD